MMHARTLALSANLIRSLVLRCDEQQGAVCMLCDAACGGRDNLTHSQLVKGVQVSSEEERDCWGKIPCRQFTGKKIGTRSKDKETLQTTKTQVIDNPNLTHHHFAGPRHQHGVRIQSHSLCPLWWDGTITVQVASPVRPHWDPCQRIAASHTLWFLPPDFRLSNAWLHMYSVLPTYRLRGGVVRFALKVSLTTTHPSTCIHWERAKNPTRQSEKVGNERVPSEEGFLLRQERGRERGSYADDADGYTHTLSPSLPSPFPSFSLQPVKEMHCRRKKKKMKRDMDFGKAAHNRSVVTINRLSIIIMRPKPRPDSHVGKANEGNNSSRVICTHNLD
ncbi:hypothetical protein B0H63DRAFT_199897 [Podospora didyma]|uniref:Uncharacterized protein n=1 Tax=Podospora didyma TaxID=330526 RepID=A0AAE0TVQ5_9PEZI|nr:hypothetical protein B0H63DRAFT_199897 [Podospora didyma]